MNRKYRPVILFCGLLLAGLIALLVAHVTALGEEEVTAHSYENSQPDGRDASGVELVSPLKYQGGHSLGDRQQGNAGSDDTWDTNEAVSASPHVVRMRDHCGTKLRSPRVELEYSGSTQEVFANDDGEVAIPVNLKVNALITFRAYELEAVALEALAVYALDEVVLYPRYRAIGRVVDSSGAPVCDVSVQLQGYTARRRGGKEVEVPTTFASARTIDDGSFVVGMSQPFSGSLSARRHGVGAARRPVDLSLRTPEVSVGDIELYGGSFLDLVAKNGSGDVLANVPFCIVHDLACEGFSGDLRQDAHRATYIDGDSGLMSTIGETSPSGRIQLRGLRFGQFRIALLPPGRGWVNYSILISSETDEIRIH